jgi:hypothetical protein
VCTGQGVVGLVNYNLDVGSTGERPLLRFLQDKVDLPPAPQAPGPSPAVPLPALDHSKRRHGAVAGGGRPRQGGQGGEGAAQTQPRGGLGH